MPSKARIVRQFKRQLLEEYDDKQENLENCFLMYLGFIVEFGSKKEFKFTEFQINDMLMALVNPEVDTRREALETAWTRTRRGGKSRDGSILATFASVLDKKAIWRAPHTDQLQQAGEWFHYNPFVKRVSIQSKNEIEIYNSPSVNIGVLSSGKIASRGADWAFYDEGGWVFKYLKIHELYEQSRPMIADSDFKHYTHFSTIARDTAFYDAWLNLEEIEIERNIKLRSLHTWKDCYWITPEFIEMERKQHRDCPWYIEQNYECIAVVYGGNAFTKIIVLGDPKYPTFTKDYFIKINIRPSRGGVDFNGENIQHYLILGHYDENFVYIMEELKFRDLNFLSKYDQLVSLELEEGQFNEPFTKQTRRMGLRCIYKQWNDIEKQNRVEEMRIRIILIDKDKCPDTYNNIMSAAFDPKSRLPKLLKRKDQHGLDGTLHFMHELGGEIQISGKRRERKPSILGGIEKQLRV